MGGTLELDIIQEFTVEAECDLCSKTEINSHSPVVCVARGDLITLNFVIHF